MGNLLKGSLKSKIAKFNKSDLLNEFVFDKEGEEPENSKNKDKEGNEK